MDHIASNLTVSVVDARFHVMGQKFVLTDAANTFLSLHLVPVAELLATDLEVEILLVDNLDSSLEAIKFVDGKLTLQLMVSDRAEFSTASQRHVNRALQRAVFAAKSYLALQLTADIFSEQEIRTMFVNMVGPYVARSIAVVEDSESTWLLKPVEADEAA